ncbi:MAG: HAD family hydrolase [Melioribacteraceae bacterium]|nr:HAD family hydrolase [Melioribacteraceae bacterium]MCF8356553.1 HAD family hydrolase [Melioribacteraceae bacterium]MCF8394212.1 HAD family hydrolase [Melioribacteraceae bacterium]MCF8419932.1 HAD family hydrolase [Melioribacteraceae bacterium]
MQNYDAYIFDVDGTLASTNELIFETFRFVSNKYLGHDPSDKEIISLFGPTEEFILREMMKEKYDEAENDYFIFYENNHDKLVKTFDGMDEVLKNLFENNKRLFVFTGKGRKSTDITLKRLGYSDYFEEIYSGDDVKDHKPSPDGINQILEKHKFDKKKVIMIGDAPVDFHAAEDAGVDFGAVMWDSYAKERLELMNIKNKFYSVEELLKFINKNGER